MRRVGIPPSELLARIGAVAARDSQVVDQCRRLLLPLARGDEARGGKLAATLLAYYANGASVSKAAEQLFLHRNSVRYRLDHVRALLGFDIDHPQIAAAILAAMRVLEGDAKTHEAQRA